MGSHALSHDRRLSHAHGHRQPSSYPQPHSHTDTSSHSHANPHAYDHVHALADAISDEPPHRHGLSPPDTDATVAGAIDCRE